MILRIVMISGFDPENFYGQSTRPYYLGSVLSQRGVRLIHICPRQPKETFASTKFIEIGAGANLLQKAIIFVRIVVQTLLFCPDIIYVHQTVWMNKLGGKLARMLRKPVVLDMHGSATQEDEAHPGAEDLAIIQQKERKALNGADLVIVVSQELKDFVQKRFGVAERILVLLPNGVNRRVFTPQRACSKRSHEMRRTLGIPETKRIVTFVCPRNGQINEIALKWFFNVVTILRQKGNDAYFLIVGTGMNYPVPADSVIYTGFVDDLHSVLDLSDVCVLPYPQNAICGGARNKALEYFASGKPVISTREGMRGIDAVPSRDYLEADTIEEFAQKILEVLSEKDLADRLSANGPAVAERYDWNTIGEKLFRVLASLKSES